MSAYGGLARARFMGNAWPGSRLQDGLRPSRRCEDRRGRAGGSARSEASTEANRDAASADIGRGIRGVNLTCCVIWNLPCEYG